MLNHVLTAYIYLATITAFAQVPGQGFARMDEQCGPFKLCAPGFACLASRCAQPVPASAWLHIGERCGLHTYPCSFPNNCVNGVCSASALPPSPLGARVGERCGPARHCAFPNPCISGLCSMAAEYSRARSGDQCGPSRLCGYALTCSSNGRCIPLPMPVPPSGPNGYGTSCVDPSRQCALGLVCLYAVCNWPDTNVPRTGR